MADGAKVQTNSPRLGAIQSSLIAKFVFETSNFTTEWGDSCADPNLCVERLRFFHQRGYFEVRGSRAGCIPLFLIAGADSGEAKYRRYCFASSGSFELTVTPPENVVIF